MLRLALNLQVLPALQVVLLLAAIALLYSMLRVLLIALDNSYKTLAVSIVAILRVGVLRHRVGLMRPVLVALGHRHGI